jgi:hypothetical protein
LPEPGGKQRPVPGLDTEEPGFSGDGDHALLTAKHTTSPSILIYRDEET